MKHGLFQAKSLKNRKVISKLKKKITDLLKKPNKQRCLIQQKMYKNTRPYSHTYFLGGIEK